MAMRRDRQSLVLKVIVWVAILVVVGSVVATLALGGRLF